jgi:exosortase/archaeosortase family protein
MLLSLASLAAFWPVWIDYARRIAADGDLALHALSAGAGWIVLARSAEPARASVWRHSALGLALACVVAHALGLGVLPAMARCLLALVGVGAFIAWQRGSARPGLGLALLVLGVPMLAQLESAIGLELRLSVTEAAAALLRIPGLLVTSEGTRLLWAGGAVDVEAPCSGLRMLWTGAFVTLLALWHFGLRPAGSIAVALAALGLVWLGNVLRSAALFYVESGLIAAPGWIHPALGSVVFLGVCIALWEGTRRMVEWKPKWAS